MYFLFLPNVSKGLIKSGYNAAKKEKKNWPRPDAVLKSGGYWLGFRARDAKSTITNTKIINGSTAWTTCLPADKQTGRE